jgi:CHAT domain-containing protein
MNRRALFCLALSLFAFFIISAFAPAQDTDDFLNSAVSELNLKPANTMSEEEARSGFKEADQAREAAKPNTQARADAADKASSLAAILAWKLFDAGKYDEAAEWFSRRADLKKEGYQSRLAFLENDQMAQALKTQDTFNPLYHSEMERLAAAKTDAERAKLLPPVVLSINTHNAFVFAIIRTVQMLATQNNDYPTLLKYNRRDLELKKSELANLQAVKATASDLNQKRNDISLAMKGVASAERYEADYANAAKDLTEALTIQKSLPMETPGRDLSGFYVEFGGLYSDQGDLTKARDSYRMALQAWAADEPSRKRALDQADASLKNLTITNQVMSHALLLNNLAQITSSLGDYKGALSINDEALKAVEEIPATGITGIFRAQMRAIILANVASAHADSGETDRAIQELKEVIDLMKPMGDDESLAVALHNLGNLSYEKGDLAAARADIEQSRQIAVASQKLRDVIPSSITLAALSREAKDYAASERYAQEALAFAQKIGDSGWLSSACRSLARLRLASNKLDEADSFLKEAETADAKTNAPLDQSATLELQGNLLEAQGKDEDALAKYEASIAKLESVRATVASASDFSNLKSNYKPYEEIVRLLIKMNRLDDAFDYLSRAKSKRLNDSLRLSNVKTSDPRLQALLDRAANLKDQLRSAQDALDTEQAKPANERSEEKIQNLKLVAATTQAEFFKVSEQIKAANPNYETLMTVKPRELKTAQRSIPDGALLVEYAPIGDQLYVFLVTQTSLKIYTPPVKPDDLWTQVREFRKRMSEARDRIADGDSLAVKDWMSDDPNVAPLRENLTTLYEMLIAPIEPEIQQAKVVAFIPTQLLYYLPIHALAKKEGDHLQFFIEEKPVAYLSAADVMAVVQQRNPADLGKGMEAFGDPAGIQPPLPHTLEEVTDIAKVYPGAVAITGAQAQKSAATSETALGKRILHFATHGVLNSLRPDESYIQLAQSNAPNASALTVGEVMGLDLSKVDLVTLSACQTALGEKNPGVEVSGLASAFSTAGASSVIASLWSVSDESTNDLMVSFYQALAGGMSKAEALREAELKLLKDPKFDHPFYWAPFILMGDWR